MKIRNSSLIALTILTVTLFAQTSYATDTLLQIKLYRWFPNFPSVGCDDCADLPQAALDYRNKQRSRDVFAKVVLKNSAEKSIKSVNLDFVFRDSATEQEFLTYHLRLDREIDPGKTKEIQHKIKYGKEPDNFFPAAPGDDLLSRTLACGDGPLLLDRKSGKLVKISDRPDLRRIRPCYYLPVVTRIDYADGSFWQP